MHQVKPMCAPRSLLQSTSLLGTRWSNATWRATASATHITWRAAAFATPTDGALAAALTVALATALAAALAATFARPRHSPRGRPCRHFRHNPRRIPCCRPRRRRPRRRRANLACASTKMARAGGDSRDRDRGDTVPRSLAKAFRYN